MKQVLVTGGKGQLGSSLQQIAPLYGDLRFTFIDLEDLDLTRENDVTAYFNHHHTDYIINCAAYTAVDQAESQPEAAFRVNADIPGILGLVAEKKKIHLIHVSTDYIYSGKSCVPHLEDELPEPVSVYAKSKYKGELSLMNNPVSMIIRTSWLYSEFGKNFMLNMLRLGGEREELGIVFDQTGTPTYAGDLARAIADILIFSEKTSFHSGIYNYSNEGVCSWYDFAREIMIQGHLQCAVKPIRTRDYPLPAHRPEYSVLDKSKIKLTFGIEIPYWKDSLSIALENLKKNQEI
jgi:dTDP-4-dehydrorhamnose reductase